jgi:hypothetical protein
MVKRSKTLIAMEILREARSYRSVASPGEDEERLHERTQPSRPKRRDTKSPLKEETPRGGSGIALGLVVRLNVVHPPRGSSWLRGLLEE